MRVSGNMLGKSGKAPEEPIEEVAIINSVAQDDYHAVFCLTLIKAAIRTATVSFSGTSEDAKLVSEAMERLWQSSVRFLAEAFCTGRCLFHVQRVNDPVGVTTARLEYIPPDSDGEPYSQMVLTQAPVPEFEGVKLSTDESKTARVTLPADQVWWFGLDATRLVPFGRSRLRGAPQRLLESRVKLMSLHDKFLRKHVLKGGVAHVDRTVQDPLTGQVLDNFILTQAFLEKMQAGSYAIMGNDRDSSGNYRNNIAFDSQVSDPQPLERSIAASDVRLGRSLGLFDKLSTEGLQNGATEGALQIHKLAFNAMIEDFVRQAAESFRDVVLPRIQQWNGLEPNELRIEVPRISDDTANLSIEIVRSVITNNTLSPLIRSGAIDIVSMLRTAGVPVAGGVEDLIETMLGEAREVSQQRDDVAGSSGGVQIGSRGNGDDGGDPRDPASQKQEPVDEEMALVSDKRYVIPSAATRAAQRAVGWAKTYRRGAVPRLQQFAKAILRGHLSRREMRQIAGALQKRMQSREAEGFHPGERGYPSNARIAWDMLGGDPLHSFVGKKLERLENSQKTG